jgi:hypothetical protein
MANSGRLRDTFLVGFVPVLLCVVAGVQIYLVELHELSRWKGAGFGMFATVDSPSARFVRLYLVSDAGEVPVLVPGELAVLSQKARVLPAEKYLSELAEALRGGTWVHVSMVSASRHYRDLLLAAGEEYRDSADDIRVQSPAVPDRIDFRVMRLFRMLAENEGPSTEAPLGVRGARVEVWRYVFDREALALRAQKIAQHTSVDE